MPMETFEALWVPGECEISLASQQPGCGQTSAPSRATFSSHRGVGGLISLTSETSDEREEKQNRNKWQILGGRRGKSEETREGVVKSTAADGCDALTGR